MTPEERRIIRTGRDAEQIGWAVVGVLRQLAAMGERSDPVRKVCDDCGGLRPGSGVCDVCRAFRRVEDRDHLIGELEWLLGTDTPARIARRLGYRSCAALARQLNRYGRADLARHFYRAEVAA